MQYRDQKIENYSIDDLNALIESIKKATNLTEEEISKRLKYNEGYTPTFKNCTYL